MSTSTGFVHTVSGETLEPVAGKISSVNLEDIAHGLSHMVRYSGQCWQFYSVAEHSLLVFDILRNLYPRDFEAQWAGLLHDATEAYICDLPTPIKALLPRYKELEESIGNQITETFDIRWTEQVKQRVKEADRIALALEVPNLFDDISDWEELVDKYRHLNYIKEDYGVLNPIQIRREFEKTVEDFEEYLEEQRDDLSKSSSRLDRT